MKIKFCGIRRLEDVAFCNELQPEYLGMISPDDFAGNGRTAGKSQKPQHCRSRRVRQRNAGAHCTGAETGAAGRDTAARQ